MKAPWLYLEDLNEPIYVADPENYSLVYMNRCAMEIFSLKTKEDYYGKKCHHVLQGLPSPCPFCTNPKLKSGCFLEWSYRNPILDQSLLLKDTLISWEGKDYRMEIAIRLDRGKEMSGSFFHYDTTINDCLTALNSGETSADGLRRMLSVTGEKFRCRRLDVYELTENETFTHAFAWSSEGCTKENESVQMSRSSHLKNWFSHLKTSDPIIIRDTSMLRDTKTDDGEDLDIDGSQVIILIPLIRQNRLRGFFRIDDPAAGTLEEVAKIGRQLSYSIVPSLERHKLVKHLKHLSYHDQLTGALNRHALNDLTENGDLAFSAGFLLCDINGLKSINELHGHHGGDKAICRVYETLISVFPEDSVYRMGGDEFFVLYRCAQQEMFDIQVQLFRRMAMENNCQLSTGAVWTEDASQDFTGLLKAADTDMHEEKERFYILQSLSNSTRTGALSTTANRIRSRALHPFLKYLRDYYFDTDTFFESIASMSTSVYFYCGDVTKNVYYISDDLKKYLNFPDNLVYDYMNYLEQRIVEEDRQTHIEIRKAMLAEKKTWQSVQYRIYNDKGQQTWVTCDVLLKWNEDKTTPLFISGSLRPIDNVPGTPPLPLKQYFSRIYKEFISEVDGSGKAVLICTSLNNYFALNQLMGNGKGDIIIWEIISNIRRKVDNGIRIIKMSDISFILLAAHDADPGRLVRLIRQTVTKVYVKNHISVIYPCSSGILFTPEDGTDPEELIRNAEIAMHSAKNTPEALYVKFSHDMKDKFQSDEELYLELNRCIRNRFENFRIVVQPQVTAQSGDIYGGEVLLRWSYKGKDVPPMKFIPLLENSGLIIPVGKWVVSETVALSQKIIKLIPGFKLSFNVSYYQISDKHFLPFIRQALAAHNISGENLMVELTETHFNEMPKRLEYFIRECRKLGLNFALDDFGSAYSSLQLLLQYPADLIKLDRSLTKEITSSEEKTNFINSIIYACHKFGKKVCVEGVETKKELDIICQTQCDFIQGFYFYRPLEVEDLLTLLRDETDAGVQAAERKENE